MNKCIWYAVGAYVAGGVDPSLIEKIQSPLVRSEDFYILQGCRSLFWGKIEYLSL